MVARLRWAAPIMMSVIGRRRKVEDAEDADVCVRKSEGRVNVTDVTKSLIWWATSRLMATLKGPARSIQHQGQANTKAGLMGYS